MLLRRGCFGSALDEPLGGADVEPAAHDFFGQCHRICGGEQRARVAAESSPSSTRRRTGAGNDKRRTVFATWLRLLPTASARLA